MPNTLTPPTTTNADRLLEALEASPMTVAQLMAATNLNGQVVRRNIRALRNQNLVRLGARKDKETGQNVWRRTNRKGRKARKA